jgi:hypothetical protein
VKKGTFILTGKFRNDDGVMVDGPLEVSGYVSEHFGIQKAFGWQVTHKATGFLCSGRFDKLREAKNYVARLEALDYNWDGGNPYAFAGDRILMEQMREIQKEVTEV